MSLQPGARLSAYEVLGLIGSGGMGRVYRARDPKLERHVALRVLPDEFVLDADRLARFKREAQGRGAPFDLFDELRVDRERRPTVGQLRAW